MTLETYLISIAYIFSISVNRYLNIKAQKECSGIGIVPITWLLPILPVIVLLIIIIDCKIRKRNSKFCNWFFHLEENKIEFNYLYKPKEEQTLSVFIEKLPNGKIAIEFSSDFGKFGTDEPLAGYQLTPERLLQILKERKDITDDELYNYY